MVGTYLIFFFFQAEDGIRDKLVTGVQTCALPISNAASTVGGPGCLLGTDSLLHKVTVKKTCPFLLMDDDRPQPAPQVRIKLAEFGRAFLGANPEVPHPASAIFV